MIKLVTSMMVILLTVVNLAIKLINKVRCDKRFWLQKSFMYWSSQMVQRESEVQVQIWTISGYRLNRELSTGTIIFNLGGELS